MTAADLDPFRVHGGRVAAARVVFGGDDWIDLSTGIAPWPYPVAAGAPDRLPEPADLAALEAAAGDAFGVSDGRAVVAVPGSDLALRLLAIVLGARRPAVVRPGYGGHCAAWPGAEAVAFDAIGSGDHDLIVLASPNNPDGQVLGPERAASLSTHAMLVVDAAFADPATGLCDGPADRIVVLRSFGKFYGLPGLRLGFVIAAPAVAGPLRALLGDWPVSAAAIATGTAAYRDRVFRTVQAKRIAEAGAVLDAVLADAELPVAGGTSLFRLVACDDADVLFRRLAAHAILTRPFADRGDRLRIGLPADTRAAVRLSAALTKDRR